jgi:hypothetical protein
VAPNGVQVILLGCQSNIIFSLISQSSLSSSPQILLGNRTHFPSIEVLPNAFHSEYLTKVFQHFYINFPEQRVHIHTFIRSKTPVAESYAKQLFNILEWSSDPYMGHICYGKIVLNTQDATMNVEVVDPYFNTDRPLLRSIFGSDSLPNMTLRMFSSLAQSASFKLTHSYQYRGDQVLNMNDCGRFSTIYLLADLEGKAVMSLTNYDIYLGFESLKRGNYDRLHETKTATFTNPSIQSRFSKYISGPLRFSCDYFLKTFYNSALGDSERK